MLWIEVARITCLELWQSRTFKILLVLAAVAPAAAITVSSLFMVDKGKVYVDGIASASQLLAIVFLVFLAVSLLSRDIYDRVCYFLLAPPLTRKEYFLGRFAGISMMFLLILAALSLSSVIGGWIYIGGKTEFYQSGYQWYFLVQMMLFHFFQYISLLGVIFFIISWSSGDAETMLFTVSVLVFSWLFPPVLKAMQDPDVAKETPEFIMTLLQWIYEALPHLDGAAISLSLAHGESIGMGTMLLYISEHSLYALVFFVLGLIIFNRRDL